MWAGTASCKFLQVFLRAQKQRVITFPCGATSHDRLSPPLCAVRRVVHRSQLCGNGIACARDGHCRSGICAAGTCEAPEDKDLSPYPTSGSTPTMGHKIEPPEDSDRGGGPGAIPAKDSFGTNNQVEGVDEADVVKANAAYTFAAYGDVSLLGSAAW